MENIEELFARRLREERRAHGLSQLKLAKKAGLGDKIVNPLEKGKSGTTLSSAAALARALEVPLAELLDDAQRPSPTPGVRDGSGLSYSLASPAHRRLFTKLMQWPEERVAALENVLFTRETERPKPRGRVKRRAD